MKNEKAVHRVPIDLHEAINATYTVKAAWDDLTSLARNVWICWVISAKKPETRSKRIERVCNDLIKGKRRPCCWPGCPHRSAQI